VLRIGEQRLLVGGQRLGELRRTLMGEAAGEMPSFSLAPFNSSAPSGSPWALEVPAFFGAP